MLDFLKRPVETFQEFLFLSGRAFRDNTPYRGEDLFTAEKPAGY